MTGSILAAIVIAASALPSSVDAQQIGRVPLPLGWERQVILNRLAKYYDVDPSGFVHPKKGPRETLGSVGFEAGRLTSVSRNWDLSRGDADADIRTIVSALSQLEGDLTCRIVTQNASSPENEAKAIRVFCGAHSVSIVTGTHNTKPTVSEAWRVRAFSDAPERAPAARDSTRSSTGAPRRRP